MIKIFKVEKFLRDFDYRANVSLIFSNFYKKSGPLLKMRVIFTNVYL